MSLNRYVGRGYTSSLGSAEGKWVASGPDSQQAQSYQPSVDEGTSFTMGGTGLSRPSYVGRRGSRRSSEHNFDADEVRNEGTKSRGPASGACFGGGANAGGSDGQKIIMFVFLVIVAILCV